VKEERGWEKYSSPPRTQETEEGTRPIRGTRKNALDHLPWSKYWRKGQFVPIPPHKNPRLESERGNNELNPGEAKIKCIEGGEKAELPRILLKRI